MNLIDILDLLQGGTDTSVNTEHFVIGSFIINDGGEGHEFKHIIELLEDRVGVIDVFAKTAGTLLTEAEVPVDISIFVVASEQEDLLGIFELQGH